MKMRMLTAIAASAMCLAAVSGAEAGDRKGGGHGGWDDHGGGHHGGGHHGGGHHGGGHHDRGRDKAEGGRGCDDHWDHNLRYRPSAAFSRRCGYAGVGVTIVGIPGMWSDGPPGIYRGYPYRYDAYGRRLGY